MRTEPITNGTREIFDSLEDLCQSAETRGYLDDYKHQREAFTHVSSPDEALQLARQGWTEHVRVTLDATDATLDKVERQTPMTRFERVVSVRGKRADLGRLMAGRPECMVTFHPREISKAGRVIVLCVSVEFSAAISTASIVKRGQVVTALALALTRLGYGVEIWADVTAEMGRRGHGKIYSARTLVKSAHDVIDTERLLFALAHPAMLRVLTFANRDARYQAAKTSGNPMEPIHDMPEGTLYIDGRASMVDVPDMDKEVLRYLRALGIVKD